MNAPQIFSNPEFGQVRVIEQEGEPWFVAKDVCDSLGIVNTTQAVGSLDLDERAMFNIGRQGNANFISESGLYTLVFKSRKEEAKKFQRWVTKEVLPSIRKTGGYQAKAPDRDFKPDPEAEIYLKCANVIADGLRLNDGSRIVLFEKALTTAGLPARQLLPDYTEEKLTKSATELLKSHGATIKTAKFNKALESLGLLEKMNRSSTSGKTKTFWSLTENGERFGKNLINSHNQKETQPHYFIDSFNDLLKLVDTFI